MISEKDIYNDVSSVADTYDFEKVSDLTKAEFVKLLSDSIAKVVAKACSEERIYQIVTDQLRRESRG